jgi:glycosyltransferase involved in cell wall biosynthesis
MRIFMLVPPPTARGPVPKHTVHLVRALETAGCAVSTHPWGQRRQGESLAPKVWQRAVDVMSIRRMVGRQQFDVVVIKTAHDWRTLARDIPAVLVLRSRRRPIVLQFHGSDSGALLGDGRRAFKTFTALLLSLVDAVLVLSTEEQREWAAFRPKTPVYTVKNPFVSVAGGVDRAPAGPRPLDILFVGRLLEEKGVLDLLEAFPLVESGDCTLTYAGAGPAETLIARRARELAVSERVTLAGYETGQALLQRYQRAAVLALPTYWGEGFPTVLAEAMDAGLPIVTTPIRGAADHLIEGENALFVEPRDVSGLASALTQLLGDADSRARMAAANRRRIQIFAPDTVAREYVDVLRVVAARSNITGVGDDIVRSSVTNS